ncbi:hypothetical protein K491DRAFT_612991 [Lophiostoma macrostomum CBS 122681]|uniref:UROD/MetE-like protein n=1 Tax=Lophiostoma macrostomum CBS 122681 TaxID=1314788 RepID=A0A6A6SK93_9PLEO|nr:hypothetical protein K491DRAFT_612991 [Lophiostoma macrostomum CBS 122681]
MALSLPPIAETIHFVGSVCLPSTRSVYHRICTSLGTHIRRLPDGEPGKRSDFILWQRDVFKSHPSLLRASVSAPSRATDINLNIENFKLGPLEYDTHAISSYRIFCTLRDEGIILPGVRFQVCLPTPINILCNLIEQAYRPHVEPLYESALLDVIAKIQDNIPAHDLAIQFDCPSEFAFLEGVASVPVDWFAPIKEGLIERVVRIASAVHDSVELGFHLCYGDFDHKHFVEPTDTAIMVDFANSIKSSLSRHINWIHMPVPKGRTDALYFAPLEHLDLGETELYLGLLHAEDEEGTRGSIQAANTYVPEFGVATECGLGRADSTEFEDVLSLIQKLLSGACGCSDQQ